MKNLKIGLLAALLLSFAAPAFAVEVTGDAYVSVYSKYLWRGFDLSPDDNFVVQPGTNLAIGGFTLGWWGNFSENTGELNEVDLTLDYTRQMGELVSISVGNIMYDIDNTVDDNGVLAKGTTNELYLGVAFNTLLSPALKVYYDYDEFDGNVFATASIGHSFELMEKLGLNLAAAAGYSFVDEEFTGTGDDESFFHNAEFSASIDYAITDKLTITALVLHSTPLSDDAKDEEIVSLPIEDETTGAITVSLSF